MQTFNAANPYVQGIAGILDAYQNAIRRVQLYGPTNFSPVVNHVSRYEMGKKIQLDLDFFVCLNYSLRLFYIEGKKNISRINFRFFFIILLSITESIVSFLAALKIQVSFQKGYLFYDYSVFVHVLKVHTLFGPLLLPCNVNVYVSMNRFAASIRDGSNYFVLLILTDGEITDTRNTIDAIVSVSAHLRRCLQYQRMFHVTIAARFFIIFLQHFHFVTGISLASVNHHCWCRKRRFYR